MSVFSHRLLKSLTSNKNFQGFKKKGSEKKNNILSALIMYYIFLQNMNDEEYLAENLKFSEEAPKNTIYPGKENKIRPIIYTLFMVCLH